MLLNKRISVGYFAKEIKSDLLELSIFAVFIGLLDLHPTFQKINLPLSIPALVGTAVSLLLAFRTGQSYERWWEARTIWGAIVNDSRSFTRLVLQFIPDDRQQARDFVDRQIIWVYALGESLRRQPHTEKVQTYLDAQGIVGSNIPNALLDEHSKGVLQLARDKKITDFQQLQLNELVVKLTDSMGKCERIKNTVFPRSYSILVHILIYVFAAILPFGMDDKQLFVEIGVTILIPILFISIEKTAILMQDPFENRPLDTPMTTLAQTIEINLLESVGAEHIPEKPVNNTYYQM